MFGFSRSLAGPRTAPSRLGPSVALALLPVLPAISAAEPTPRHGAPVLWARALGGVDGVQGLGVAVDAMGSVVTTGKFWGTADFDPGPGTFNLTSAGQNDAFVSKLDRDGNFLWAAALGGAGSDQALWVVVDAAGDIYAAGEFWKTADLDPGPGTFHVSTVGFGGFVSKLDGAGNFLWGAALGDNVPGVAVDGTGSVYTTGYFQGVTDFDPGPGTFNLTAVDGIDAFVAKLRGDGGFVWARAFGGPGWAIGRGAAVDGSGNVFAAGYFRGTADFDPGPGNLDLTSAGATDGFVSKLDGNGDLVWAHGLGGTGVDTIYGVAVDGSGNVHTTGYFYDTVDFDPGPGTFDLTSFAGHDAFVSKLDNAGDLVWARALAGRTSAFGHGVAVDGSGDVYVTGGFAGRTDFDPGPGTLSLKSDRRDGFVCRLDAAGRLAWAYALGGTGSDQGWSVAVDGSGNAYVSGFFSETADFEPGRGVSSLTAAGSIDAFVTKLHGFFRTRCLEVEVATAAGACVADASIDGGSLDPDGHELTLSQEPPAPYELGVTEVKLTVGNGLLWDACRGAVTVVDRAAPYVSCNAPPSISPWEVPVSFTATGSDNCSLRRAVVRKPTCHRRGGDGLTEAPCDVAARGDTLTIQNAGRSDEIRWLAVASDPSGNRIVRRCRVAVVGVAP